MFEQTFKNIDDILHKDAGCGSELDYVEQTSWVLFLKKWFDFSKINNQSVFSTKGALKISPLRGLHHSLSHFFYNLGIPSGFSFLSKRIGIIIVFMEKITAKSRRDNMIIAFAGKSTAKSRRDDMIIMMA